MSRNLTNVFPRQNIPKKESFVASARSKAAIILKYGYIKNLSVLHTFICFNKAPFLSVPEPNSSVGMARHNVIAITVILYYVHVRLGCEGCQRLAFGQPKLFFLHLNY
jgi:hypothetical protein